MSRTNPAKSYRFAPTAKASQPAPPVPDWFPRKLLTETEAAELIGVAVPTLQTWRCTKVRDLPYFKVGTCVRYEPTAVWSWLCQNKHQAVALAL